MIGWSITNLLEAQTQMVRPMQKLNSDIIIWRKMKHKDTYLSAMIAFLFLASIPFLPRYTSMAGYFAADCFSNFVYKIGDKGGLTGVFLSLFLAIFALLISITIIIVFFVIPIWQGTNQIKKGLFPKVTPFMLVMYYFSLLISGFFVSFIFFTIDTIEGIMK